jgi:hypothetical protein
MSFFLYGAHEIPGVPRRRSDAWSSTAVFVVEDDSPALKQELARSRSKAGGD